jgi:hypothetical protein
MVTSQVGSPDSRPASMRAAARCGLRRSVERPSRDAGLRTLGCEFDDLGLWHDFDLHVRYAGALVDGRSRRADGFCSGLRRSVNASRTPCASCGTSAITRCVRCRIVRMWWPGPWDRAVRSGWLLLDLAMTTMHCPRSVDCQVLITRAVWARGALAHRGSLAEAWGWKETARHSQRRSRRVRPRICVE